MRSQSTMKITTDGGVTMASVKHSLRDPNRPPVHPGAILNEIVLADGSLTKAEFARALGVSRQSLHGILAEKHPITVEMAVRLGHVLGNGPDIWLRVQQAYDLWHARRRVDTSTLKVLPPDKAA